MIAILQPFIPHYRKDFFLGLKEKFNLDLFCYNKAKKATNSNFNLIKINEKEIPNLSFGPFLIYNPFVLLSKKYESLVLMWHFGHLSTWFLLLTKPIHKKKIILWGQGISVKRYKLEKTKPSTLLRWMLILADTIWFYTEKEKQQWSNLFPKKNMKALGNTISGIDKIVSYDSKKNKKTLKEQYQIQQQICFIFCARFNNNFRRQDLLLDSIKRLDPYKYGFIIIGEGDSKPDFTNYKNVYDYGAVYDTSKKQDLFTIADLYYQPGWVGLSVVEALGYGKPVITYKRSQEVLQCVEYYYVINNYNGLIFSSVDEFLVGIKDIKTKEIEKMSNNAKDYVRNNLMMSNMINKASISLIKNNE